MKITALLLLILILTAPGSLNADPPKSGQSLGTITTTDGKTYADAKLAVIEPDGISILYADGGAKIPFTSLSPEVQEEFGYDPEKSAFYAREQQYLAQIDQLKQENVELRRQLASVPQAQVPSAAPPVAPQQQQHPTIAGFHQYFFELAAQSTRVGGRVDQGYFSALIVSPPGPRDPQKFAIHRESSTLSKTFNRRSSANIGTGRGISAFIGATGLQKMYQWYDWALWYAMSNPRQTSASRPARSYLSVRLRCTSRYRHEPSSIGVSADSSRTSE